MNKKDISKLKKILNKKTSKFENYQEIPEFILNKLLKESIEIKYKQNQLSLDKARLNFLTSNLKFFPKRILEIGSNMGYFAFSFLNDFNTKVIAYEPIKDYAELITLLSKLLKIEKQINVYSKSVKLKNIKSLPMSDLIIELNVLHHAGNYFDKLDVKKLGGWRKYAAKRLRMYRRKTKYLFFQTGNSGKVAHFNSTKSVKFISKLLKDSGWKIVAFGTIKNLNKLIYNKGNLNLNASFKTYECVRNHKTNLVDYKINNQIVKSLKTGMAARPIWICKS